MLTKLCLLFAVATMAWGQARPSAIPRLPSGKPDFNGLWQAISPANYDIERHMARASMMLRQGPHGPLPAVPLLRLGAVGSVPASMGIVDGG